MSRGLGWLQVYLLRMLRNSDKPLAFADMLRIAKPFEGEYRPHMERSMRRALKGLMKDCTVIPLGVGGPSDPHRYCFNPASYLQATPPQMDDFAAGMKMLEGDPHWHHRILATARGIAVERGWRVEENSAGMVTMHVADPELGRDGAVA
jgi:hypothetical protein